METEVRSHEKLEESILSFTRLFIYDLFARCF